MGKKIVPIKKMYHQVKNCLNWVKNNSLVMTVKNKCSNYTYNQHLKTIEAREKDKKVNIIFLVQKPELWNTLKSVYKAGSENERVSTALAVMPERKDKYWKYDQSSIEFYRDVDNNCIILYNEKRDEFKLLNNFYPDYIIYERPYNTHFPKLYKTKKVKKIAKVCYIPYGFILTKSDKLLKAVFPMDFFADLYVFFASWDYVGVYLEQIYRNSGYTRKKVAYLGYPRFDLFLGRNKKQSNDITKILWTPRWTITGNIERDLSSYSTFFDYKDRILERCTKDGQNEFWTVRPHPLTFSNYIKHGLMSEIDLEAYKNTLEKTKKICLDINKDYLIAMNEADIIITDFSSLIIEYFVAGKTIIYCGEREALPMNELKDGIYISSGWEGTTAFINKIKAGQDPLKEKREQFLNKIDVNNNGTSGHDIVDYILNDHF